MRILTQEELEEYGIVPKEKRDAISGKVEETFKFFEENFGRQFTRPVVVYDLRGHTAGYANYKENTIRINHELLATHYEEILNQTVPHEVCHLVVRAIDPYAKAHGWKWQQLMRSIGLEPHRTHSLQTRPAKVKSRPYKYRCDCQIHMLTYTLHSRICRGQHYTCKNCGARLVEVTDDE